MNVQQYGRTLSISISGNSQGQVELFTLNGTKIASRPLTAGKATLSLDNMQSGIYMVKVDGLGVKKIAIK